MTRTSTPPQQFRPGGASLVPELVAEVQAVGEAEHPRGEGAEQLGGKAELSGRARPEGRIDDGVGTALRQGHHAHLGKGAVLLAAAVGGPTEGGGVGRGVGHIQDGPIDRHQPPAPIPHPATAGGAERNHDIAKQRPQRLDAETSARLENGGLGGHRPPGAPAPRPGQALHQRAHHFLVGSVTEERHGHDVVDDHPGRQQPMASLLAATARHRRIDDVRWEGPSEHADRDVVREPSIRLRLPPSRPWHPDAPPWVRPAYHLIPLSKRYWG